MKIIAKILVVLSLLLPTQLLAGNLAEIDEEDYLLEKKRSSKTA
jgi:hypothetical protein